MNGSNVTPVTVRDAEKLEAAYRRAIDGVEPELRALRRRLFGDYATLPGWWVFTKDQAPALLNLAGSALIAAVVWPHLLPLLGVGCFVASSLISMRRAAR